MNNESGAMVGVKRMKKVVGLLAALSVAGGSSMAAQVAAVDAASATGLGGVLRAVVLNNPAVKGKRAELAAQGHVVKSAEAARLPSLTGQVSNLNDNTDQGLLRLQQPLWTFGRIESGIDYAEAGYDAERLGVLQVQRTLIEEAAGAYAGIDGIRRRLAVARDNVAEHERLVQRIVRREKGQLASEADVSLATSRLIQAKAQQRQLEGELRVALSELRALTVVAVEARGEVAAELTAMPSAEELKALAARASAEVRYKQARVEVAQRGIRKERNAAMPTLSLRAEHDFFDVPVGYDRSRVGLVLEGSLDGMGMVSRGNTQRAVAQYEAAREDLNVALNEVARRVDTLLSSRDVAAMQVQLLGESVEAVEATAASYLRQFESGRKSWLDVLNIQREVTDQRLRHVQTQSEWLTFTLRLAALTGKLDAVAGVELP